MKKGISLIVLVITIIVIIILAGAVIFSLAQNNPIGQANEAVRAQDEKEVESALTMYLGSIMAQYKDQVKLSVTVPTDISETITVQNSSGNDLYKQADGTINTDDTGTQLKITPAVLGLSSWPTSPGYTLTVDQFASVRFVQD